MRKTYLYIKEHNQTGLKYFGRTVRDPIKYKGSGVYWNRHLDKHGNDVSTIWYQAFTDEKEFREYAEKFSAENNIVEDMSWANLVDETGFMGGFNGLTEEGRKRISETSKVRRHSEETKEKIRAARAKQAPTRLGAVVSEETKAKIRKTLAETRARKKELANV